MNENTPNDHDFVEAHKILYKALNFKEVGIKSTEIDLVELATEASNKIKEIQDFRIDRTALSVEKGLDGLMATYLKGTLSGKFVHYLVNQFLDLLHATNAPNYLETTFTGQNGQQVIALIQKKDGKSPNDLVVEEKEKNAKLEKTILELQNQLKEASQAITDLGGIHVCEGGGPENLAASIAVTVAKLANSKADNIPKDKDGKVILIPR